MVMDIMKKELKTIQERFADDRKTQIVAELEDLSIEDLIAEENMVVTISHTGYIKRIATSVYRRQGRGGRGITAMGTKETDFVEDLFVASTHDYILFFTDRGRAYWLKVYSTPQGGRQSKGKAIVNLIPIQEGENITAMIPVADFTADRYLIMATERGIVKKTRLDAFSNPRKVGIIAILLDEGDRLLSVQMTGGQDEVILASRNGMAIRFDEAQVRPTGRNTHGVHAMNLEQGDRVVGMVATRPESQLLTITEHGFGKRTIVSEYRKIRRGGKGVIDIQTSERNGKVVCVMEVVEEDEIMLITQKGIAMRCGVREIRLISRNTQGVRIIRVDEDDRVVAAAKIRETNGENASSEA
jgi:DNA gyrase subunit A